MFLDTSYCVDLLREQNRKETGPATAKLADMGSEPLHMPLFVACELHAGARLSAHPRSELKKVHLFCEKMELVLPSRTFPTAYGEMEAFLRKKGTPIPVMDLMIGVLAKAHGSALLCRDLTHFALLPGLSIETY